MFTGSKDPALFNSAELETANMTVLHCQKVLEQTGMTAEATQLRGIEVTDPYMAEIALDVLNKMRVKAEAQYARSLAIQNLNSALGR
jgi:hypothetical protein